ncbi:MAG: tRNA-(ms[2]io[6]A)-hydroxylase [Alteromonadaceae bacterium]|nr:tRNA-(ms[2]io[6]A)-hydroxylase [Alteromonadaceae bacterium]
MSSVEVLMGAIQAFLPCRTPDAWVAAALQPDQEPTLLIDHANCEKKAAATALALMHRYTDNPLLLNKMSRLAREELRHFEQVIKMMAARDITYKPLSASRYAQGLRKGVRRQEPGRLIDTLIVGALIEARSCERFARLAPELDKELGDFYFSLLKSEARHYSDYLRLAESLASDGDLTDRLEYFRGLEAGLVESEDTEFRFHSGPVATQH